MSAETRRPPVCTQVVVDTLPSEKLKYEIWYNATALRYNMYALWPQLPLPLQLCDPTSTDHEGLGSIGTVRLALIDSARTRKASHR